ncbi:hypothetical protein B0A54_14403 [Friedmanniomyces endolithicus]|uniref:Uncharacterized protein n=1 Tax=Friedmanniomyces endolithicus TaxID=329885 RepID=A0A4U0UCS3_9PEZI|nr:hypothetical protein LTS09_011869 [Friedmanniomyces endolithicus]TKA33017.1 hypothetical protein B0A54_14403 [Friedmanniomyces endolithicus]
MPGYEEDSFDAAAKLRPSNPPPVPPKPVTYNPKRVLREQQPPAGALKPSGFAGASPPIGSNPSFTETQAMHSRRVSIGQFALLPRIAASDRPREFPHPFSVNVELHLLRPCHLYKLPNLREPDILAQHGTVAYISPSHSLEQMRDQLVVLASTLFGLNLSDTERWRCLLTGSCDAARDSATSADFGAIVSASRQGGWTWTLSLVEVIKNERGRWSSMGVVEAPIVLDPRGINAVKAKTG